MSIKSNWNGSTQTDVLRFPNKQLRARAIEKYVVAAGYGGVVVFTCGNAAQALRERFAETRSILKVVEVGPRGHLKTDKWWTPAEIHATWPELFDATSGHLPLPLIMEVAKEFRNHFVDLDGCVRSNTMLAPINGRQYYVPTGSGETIVALQMAFPDVLFAAVYDNNNPSTTRDPEAPLNKFVDDNFRTEYWPGTRE